MTGQFVDPRAGLETVRQYAERWRGMQDHRPGTAALYERVLSLHVYPVLGDLPLRSVRYSHARAFVSGLPGPCSRTWPRQVHAVMRTIFRSAVADKLSPSTPLEKMPLPKVQCSEV